MVATPLVGESWCHTLAFAQGGIQPPRADRWAESRPMPRPNGKLFPEPVEVSVCGDTGNVQGCHLFACFIAALLPSGLGGVQYMEYYGCEPSSQANHTNLCTRLRARHPR